VYIWGGTAEDCKDQGIHLKSVMKQELEGGSGTLMGESLGCH
jgi:hypothetical protein